MDATEIARAKDRFLSIKIEKNENLEQFAKRYYVLAQDLKFEGSLSLIDAKNAMYQALAPHRFLSAVCTSHIVAATNIKAITNMSRNKQKILLPLVKNHLALIFLALPPGQLR